MSDMSLRRKPTERLYVPIVSPENLEKAAELRRQINLLEEEYSRLLSSPPPERTMARSAVPAQSRDLSEGASESTPAPAEKSSLRKVRAAGGGLAVAQSRRAPSISELNRMSLREAVVRALRIARGPQTLEGILRKLRMIHYRFHEGTDAARFLSERIYNLPGVKAVGGGYFDLVERIQQPAPLRTVQLSEVSEAHSALQVEDANGQR